MSHGQPEMQWENTRLYSKTENYQKEHNIFINSRYLCSSIPETIKAKRSSVSQQNKEGNGKQPRTNVSHHYVNKSGFSSGGILMFKDNQEKGHQRHKFPYNHEYKCVIC